MHQPTYLMTANAHDLRTAWKREQERKRKASNALHQVVTSPTGATYEGTEDQAFLWHNVNRPASPTNEAFLDIDAASSTAVVSSIDRYRWLPESLRLIPVNAYLFGIGFLFPPAFLLGSFYPRLDTEKTKVAPKGDDRDNFKLPRYSYRAAHVGVLPEVDSIRLPFSF